MNLCTRTLPRPGGFLQLLCHIHPELCGVISSDASTDGTSYGLQLRGTHALITGSSSGIGEGITKALTGEGAVVLIHGRDAALARHTTETIKTNYGGAHSVLGDLPFD
jgi:hypothetical protein